MLQRSPTYVVSLPGEDRDRATRCAASCPSELAYAIVRWKNVLLTMASFSSAAVRPSADEELLVRKGVERQLPSGYDIDTHFTPRYDPWDQRLCLVPDGDLFEAIGSGQRLGRHRPRSTPSPRPASGCARARELEADVIVTATGLNLLALGGIELAVDGARGRASPRR